jgi:hypothetical protein
VAGVPATATKVRCFGGGACPAGSAAALLTLAAEGRIVVICGSPWVVLVGVRLVRWVLPVDRNCSVLKTVLANMAAQSVAISVTSLWSVFGSGPVKVATSRAVKMSSSAWYRMASEMVPRMTVRRKSFVAVPSGGAPLSAMAWLVCIPSDLSVPVFFLACAIAASRVSWLVNATLMVTRGFAGLACVRLGR